MDLIRLIVLMLLFQIASILLVIKSFQIMESPFGSEDRSDGRAFIVHRKGSVCRLGKFGAWLFMLWSILSVFIVSISENTDNAALWVGIIGIIGVGIMFICCHMMNPPLFRNSIPFFVVQAILAAILIFSNFS